MGKGSKDSIDEASGNMLSLMMAQVEELDFGVDGENDPKRLLVEGFQISRLFAIVDFALSQAGVEDGILAGMDLMSREKAVKAINGTFLIEAVGDDKKTVQQFYVEMKKAGRISLGPGPAKPKPDVVIRVADRDMIALATGKITPQVAFMRGKIKVRGNIMKGLQMQTIMNRETSKLSKL
ncbi:hypothetical protein OC834_001481 [Tilletia horrida]|uniref:SCP2 domain-containing protein n=1 Tax=Tilletia horrida TaxID=155126 RepID=A0AAN6G8P2_9BASI|nr:hypothetical protein OC842_004989 [Tilletia horrida]KAK0535527.1 hypothetical protein OC834_001481 [Tilletia horrida]KAK0566325.1 hypothetical protein OC844_000786 [Tilletia horrida]